MQKSIEGTRRVPLRIANAELYQRICGKFAEAGLRSYDFSASATIAADSTEWNLEVSFGEHMQERFTHALPADAHRMDDPMLQSFLDEVVPLIKQSVVANYRKTMNNRTSV